MTRQGRNTTTHRLWAATVAAALLALMLAVAASAQAKAPRTFWGVAPQTALDQNYADLDRMGQGKVGTVRIPVFWSEVDGTDTPGDTNWASVDGIFAGAARNGIEVLPFLYGTPQWVAQGLDGHHCQPAKCAIFPPKSAQALAAWKTFVGEFVDRYGPNGSFWTENPTIPKVPIEVVQTWNEQNSSAFFAPKANPAGYAKLLAATHDAVSDHNPQVEVLLGGMAELAGSKKAIPADKYLAKLYRVSGVKSDFEGVSIHPYGASLKKVSDQVDLFRDVMKHGHDSKAELWVTEIGAGSASGGNPLNRGLQGQARLLKQIFKYFEKNRNRFNVQNVTWYSWMDSSVSFCDWCKTSGLFKAGLKPKPAWRAFTKFTGGS
jgi:hypothetical protein